METELEKFNVRGNGLHQKTDERVYFRRSKTKGESPLLGTTRTAACQTKPKDMAELKWNSFTKRIHIKSDIENIYRCWSTPEGITSWFLKEANYMRNGQRIHPQKNIKPGDLYTWMWYNWDGKETEKILEANGKAKIKFTFANNCTVTIRLEQKESAVLLSLEQAEIPEDDQSKLEIFYGCSNGWTFWLANLKAYVEHGILLNEKDIDLRGFDLSGKNL